MCCPKAVFVCKTHMPYYSDLHVAVHLTTLIFIKDLMSIRFAAYIEISHLKYFKSGGKIKHQNRVQETKNASGTFLKEMT